MPVERPIYYISRRKTRSFDSYANKIPAIVLSMSCVRRSAYLILMTSSIYGAHGIPQTPFYHPTNIYCKLLEIFPNISMIVINEILGFTYIPFQRNTLVYPFVISAFSSVIKNEPLCLRRNRLFFSV